jgi:DNA polymerase
MVKRVFGAGAVVYFKDGKTRFLFLVREGGRFDLPKGKINAGESTHDAAAREVKEETGFDIAIDGSFEYDVDYSYALKGERIKKQVTMFLAEVDRDAKVRISEEHSRYAWLDYGSAMKKLQFEEWRKLITVANFYIDNKERMKKLNSEYSKLPAKRKNWSLSKRLVPGEGSLCAEVMFVGQAPGANEDIHSRPFIGSSGKLLDRLIGIAGLERHKCYITSMVQFFPPKNRIPTDIEIGECKGFLLKQIGMINPSIVVLLGAVAAKAIVGAEKIMKTHGTVIKKDGFTYFLTLHPAAAVRLKKNVPIIEKDFAKLKKLINRTT